MATSANSAASGWSSSGTPRSSATIPCSTTATSSTGTRWSWSPPMRTRTWFHTGAFRRRARGQPAVRGRVLDRAGAAAPGVAADAAAMRPPDTVLPEDLNPFEIQEAYRALKGRALRVETYAADGSTADGESLHRHRAELHHQLPAAHGAEPARGFLRQPARDGVVPLRARPGRPAGRPRGDLETDAYGNVQRSVSIGYPRRTGYAPPEPSLPVRPPRRCSPTTRRGCTCVARPAATPTRSTTSPSGRTPTGCRWRRP